LGAYAKVHKSMKNQKVAMPKKLILALSFVVFSVIFCYGSFLYWKVGFSLNHVVSYLYYDWENLEIDADEIPVYPNAKNVSIPHTVLRTALAMRFIITLAQTKTKLTEFK
jgi:hypothetical protein